MGVLRLAHVDVRTPDLDLSTAYYTEVMGLSVTERTADAVYFKCWDEEDHHSLRLRYNPRTGLDLFSFRVEAEDDLAELARVAASHIDDLVKAKRNDVRQLLAPPAFVKQRRIHRRLAGVAVRPPAALQPLREG